MTDAMKFILHCHNPDNLTLFARAARYCAERDLEEGQWGVLSYEGPDGPIATISYIKRKSCVTLYYQPNGGTDGDR